MKLNESLELGVVLFHKLVQHTRAQQVILWYDSENELVRNIIHRVVMKQFSQRDNMNDDDDAIQTVMLRKSDDRIDAICSSNSF